jgi:SAM-dependent methyltransferase
MTERLWNLYLQLQTTIPYGDGFANKKQQVTEPSLDFRNFLSKWVKIDSVKRVLDFGPGGVQELFLLKRTFPDAEVHALTAHKPEADFIKQHPHGYKANFGDMHDAPYKNESFHFVFSSNVLEHSISPYISLMECRRVLTNPGWAVFILPSFAGREGGIGPYHLHCLDFNVWHELLKKTGFHVLDRNDDMAGKQKDSKYCRYTCKTVPLPDPHNKVMGKLKAYKVEILG